MTSLQLLALLAVAATAVTQLLITQTKQRVEWPGWLVPAAAVVVLAGWVFVAAIQEGPFAFLEIQTSSRWGIAIWLNMLLCATAAFFLLQNRARAAGMKSEVWVLLVIFTGGIGLLAMLAVMLYLERQQPR
jgi:hypothetical protein